MSPIIFVSFLFLLIHSFFSRVLRYSTPRYVGPSVGWLVGRSVGPLLTFSAFLSLLSIRLLPRPSPALLLPTRLGQPCIRTCQFRSSMILLLFRSNFQLAYPVLSCLITEQEVDETHGKDQNNKIRGIFHNFRLTSLHSKPIKCKEKRRLSL